MCKGFLHVWIYSHNKYVICLCNRMEHEMKSVKWRELLIEHVGRPQCTYNEGCADKRSKRRGGETLLLR